MTDTEKMKECREAFEAAFKKVHGNSCLAEMTEDGLYRTVYACRCWLLWQAAWNTRSAPTVDVEGLRKYVPTLEDYMDGSAMQSDLDKAVGWNDCLDHLAANNMLRKPVDGWQDVANPPDTDRNVLACWPDGAVRIARYMDGRYWFESSKGFHMVNKMGFTHWVDLPAPPEATAMMEG